VTFPVSSREPEMKLEKSADEVLIRLIAETEKGAFEVLYDRYNRLVFSVALAIVGDRSVAEEVTLDVFVHVWRGAHTYHAERARVSTWLAAITRHHAIDVLRWQSARLDQNSLYLDELPFQKESGMPDLQEEAETAIQKKRIREAVAQLPANQQEALMLAFFKGYSHQQIADLLEEPLGTVKTRIRRAMQQLRTMLLKESQPSDTSEQSPEAYTINRKD